MARLEHGRKRPSYERLQQRFAEFSDIHTYLIYPLLSLAPSDIGDVQSGQTLHLLAEHLPNIYPASRIVRENVSNELQAYIELERSISTWEQHMNASEVVKNVIGIEEDRVRIERMHGGYSVIVPQDVFQDYLGAQVFEDGKAVAQEKEDFLFAQISQAGFLLDETTTDQMQNLPKGAHIAIILDTPRYQDSIAHEEGEVLGEMFDTALSSDPSLKRLDALASSEYPQEISQHLRPIAYDSANRILDGASNINLSDVGFVPQDIQEHPQEVALVSRVLSGINARLKNADVEIRQALAADLRGGAIRFENLVPLFGTEEEPAAYDFSGISLKAKKEGRFVYNQPTLKMGEKVSLNGISYQIEQVVKAGGQGVVYKAIGPDGKSVAVKELQIDVAEAVFADKSSAKAVIDALEGTHGNNPQEVYAAFKNIIGTSDASQEYISFLDQQMRTNFSLATLRQAVTTFVATNPLAEKLRKELTEATQSFMNEAYVLGGLREISIVAQSKGIIMPTKFDPARSDSRRLLLIQEWVEGELLEDRLQGSLLGTQESVDFVREFLKGLQEIHKRNVVHKDIKPENIFITPQGWPKLVDFGIAKGHMAEINAAHDAGYRAKTTAVGTPGYASPEQIFGKTDARSDIYATGMLLYKMVIGKDPSLLFDQNDPADSQKRRYGLVKAELDKTDQWNNRHYPVELAEIILKAIHPDPDKRWQTAAEMADALNITIVRKDAYLDSLQREAQDALTKVRPKDKQLPSQVTAYIRTISDTARRDFERTAEMLSRFTDFYKNASLPQDSNIAKELREEMYRRAQLLFKSDRYNNDVLTLDTTENIKKLEGFRNLGKHLGVLEETDSELWGIAMKYVDGKNGGGWDYMDFYMQNPLTTLGIDKAFDLVKSYIHDAYDNRYASSPFASGLFKPEWIERLWELFLHTRESYDKRNIKDMRHAQYIFGLIDRMIEYGEKQKAIDLLTKLDKVDVNQNRDQAIAGALKNAIQSRLDNLKPPSTQVII